MDSIGAIILAAGLPIKCVHNADYEAGPPFSTRAGFLAAPDAQDVLIVLGDQTHLTAKNLCTQLLADQANPGCGEFTRAYPELSQHVPMSQLGFFNDIDTPAAFVDFEQLASQRSMT